MKAFIIGAFALIVTARPALRDAESQEILHFFVL